MALSAELIDQLDALVSTNEHVVGYSEQKMPEVRGGSPTGREAIRIYVDVKYPAGELSSAELLPEELAGQPVDVVAVGRPERHRTGAPPGVAEEVQVDPKTRIRPLIGGVSGGLLTPPKTGTLGYFVKRGEAMCVMTSAHVLVTQGGDAIQPGSNDGGTSADKVGQVVVTVDDGNAGVDAAAAKITGDVTVTLTVNEIGPIKGSVAAKDGDGVRKSGKNSGLTSGTVEDASAAVTIDGVLYKQQILIDGGSQPFSVPGDSGSLVVVGDKATGLIMAGNTQTKKSWANKIANVLNSLGATLPDA